MDKKAQKMKKLIIILAICFSCQAAKMPIQTTRPTTIADTLPETTRTESKIAEVFIISLAVLFVSSIAVN